MPNRFKSPVLQHDIGMKINVVPVPDKAVARLPSKGKEKRILVTINGKTVRRALQGRQGGERHFMLGKSALRDLGVKLGQEITVSLEEDPSPEVIDVVDEFAEALRQDSGAKKRWDSLTTGQKRSLAYYISSAKRSETRVRRSVEICEKMRTYTLHGDLRKG